MTQDVHYTTKQKTVGSKFALFYVPANKAAGVGVMAEDQPRLFQKFIRGQGSALVHTEGTGLGLYVGRMMVESHGGTIWVESKGEGFGSTFAFAIPLPPAPKDQAVVALEEMLG